MKRDVRQDEDLSERNMQPDPPPGDAPPNGSPSIEPLNALPHEEAFARLLNCCGSTRWAQLMSEKRPFHDARELFETADRIWWRLDAKDWLEAFRAHPQIGERKADAAVSADAQRWSEAEQSATLDASSATLDALAKANRAYAEKFGHIFIVCATGKTTEEMLALLQARLPNEPDAELRIAAEEQRRITALRLQKLLNT